MKYILTRTDGQPIPATARFFILRLDDHGKPGETLAARLAVAKYADDVRVTDPDASRAAERVLLGLNTASAQPKQEGT